MQLPVTIFQYDSDMGDRQIIEDKNGVMSVAVVKCFDSVSVMSNFDGDTRAISAPAKLTELRDTQYRDAGVAHIIPWCVIHGAMAEFAEGIPIVVQEAILAAQFARAAARPGEPAVIALDLEPYDQFWTGPREAVNLFVDTYVAYGGQQLIIYADTRETALGGFYFDEWMKRSEVVEVWSQIYPDEFQQPWRDACDASLYPLQARGIAPARWRPALSGNISPEDFVAAVEHIHSLGAAGVSEYRYGTFKPETVSAVLGLVDPWGQTATTPPQGQGQTGPSNFIEIVGTENNLLLNDVGAGALGTLMAGNPEVHAYVRVNDRGGVDYYVENIPRRAFPDIPQLQ